MNFGFAKTILPELFVLVSTLEAATAICPAYFPETELLHPPFGSLYHEEKLNLGTKQCRWSFPVFKITGHVILVKFTSVSLYDSGCIGTVRMPGFAPFCNKPNNTCFIYASPPLCDMQTSMDLLRNENCAFSYWTFDKFATRDIRFKSTRNRMMSFSMDYKYFSCNRSTTAKKNVGNVTSMDVITTKQFVTPGNETSKPIDSGISSGTLAGVIAFFILLVLACLVILVLQYRRLRGLKSGSRVPRIQYELAKPRDITVLGNPNTERFIDSNTRQSNFHLHGEHHQPTDIPNDRTTRHEDQTDISFGYSIHAGHGQDTTADYNSFTSDESNTQGLIDTSYTYATIDKTRAATTG